MKACHNHEGGGRTTPDGLADHIVHRRAGWIITSVVMPAVADQDHLDAGLFLQVGGGVVVAGQPGDRLAVGDFLEQIG
jgi:hypothetical protein